MPKVTVLFYRDDSKRIEPCKEWLITLKPAARAKGIARLKLLAQLGNLIRRPYADYLRNGIYELRWKSETVQYRILYFYHGKNVILLSNGFAKQRSDIPAK